MRHLAAHGVDWVDCLTPGQLKLMTEVVDPREFPTLPVRHVMSSGEALPVAVAAGFLRRFPTTTVGNCLSTTETAADLCCLKSVTLELCDAIDASNARRAAEAHARRSRNRSWGHSRATNAVAGKADTSTDLREKEEEGEGEEVEEENDAGGGEGAVLHVPVMCASVLPGSGHGSGSGLVVAGSTVVWGNELGWCEGEGSRLLCRGWNMEPTGYSTGETPGAFVPRRFQVEGRAEGQAEGERAMNDGGGGGGGGRDRSGSLDVSSWPPPAVGYFLTGDRSEWRAFPEAPPAPACSSLASSSTAAGTGSGAAGTMAPAVYHLCMEGRVDDVVKVRGYRVDLAGVEAALTSCPFVRDCAAIAHEDSVWAVVVLQPDPIAATTAPVAAGALERGAWLAAVNAHVRRSVPPSSRPALVACAEVLYGRTGKKDRKRMARELLPKARGQAISRPPAHSAAEATTAAAAGTAAAAAPKAIAATAEAEMAAALALAAVPASSGLAAAFPTAFPAAWSAPALAAAMEAQLGGPLGANGESFFDVGGNSFKALRLCNDLGIPVVLFFAHPDPASLHTALKRHWHATHSHAAVATAAADTATTISAGAGLVGTAPSAASEGTSAQPSRRVVVSGMAVRLPGGVDSLGGFWRALLRGGAGIGGDLLSDLDDLDGGGKMGRGGGGGGGGGGNYITRKGVVSHAGAAGAFDPHYPQGHRQGGAGSGVGGKGEGDDGDDGAAPFDPPPAAFARRLPVPHSSGMSAEQRGKHPPDTLVMNSADDPEC